MQMTNINDPKREVAVKATLRVPGEPDKAIIAFMPLDVALRDGWKVADAA